MRRYAGRSKWDRLTCPRRTGRLEAFSRASRGGQATRAGPEFPVEGWQAALRLWLEKQLKSETHEPQVPRGNHVEGQVHGG